MVLLCVFQSCYYCSVSDAIFQAKAKQLVFTSKWSNFWHAFASRGFVSDSWAFLLFPSLQLLFCQIFSYDFFQDKKSSKNFPEKFRECGPRASYHVRPSISISFSLLKSMTLLGVLSSFWSAEGYSPSWSVRLCQRCAIDYLPHIHKSHRQILIFVVYIMLNVKVYSMLSWNALCRYGSQVVTNMS